MELSEQYVLSLLPSRRADAHKGDFGRVLFLCGSVGYTGAPALAAMGAARCGSGLIYVGVPQAVYPIVASKLTEPMVFPLPDEDGVLSEAAVAPILSRLQTMDAVVLGCGSGQSSGVLAVVKAVLENSKVPVVLDADGINVLARHIDVLRESTCPCIVTPHPGEFARLGGDLRHFSREEAAVRLARDLHCVCVLKGRGTVITDGRELRINPTGNPGMATGGSGDVLAGIIGALAGMGLSPLDAASAGAWLHGRAGDVCASEIGQYGMLPSDLLHVLPRLLP